MEACIVAEGWNFRTFLTTVTINHEYLWKLIPFQRSIFRRVFVRILLICLKVTRSPSLVPTFLDTRYLWMEKYCARLDEMLTLCTRETDTSSQLTTRISFFFLYNLSMDNYNERVHLVVARCNVYYSTIYLIKKKKIGNNSRKLDISSDQGLKNDGGYYFSRGTALLTLVRHTDNYV